MHWKVLGLSPIEFCSTLHEIEPCDEIWCMYYVNGLPYETPLWDKCEDETHIPKSGKLESSRTPKNSELDCRGQISLHWSVLYVIGKVLKCRCPKWPCMSHLNICSPSYGQKRDMIPTSTEWMQHGVGKLSRRATTLV
jgi:hypothetical protein